MNVLGLVTKEDRILIGKVIEAKLQDFGGIEYIFPGGKVEEMEAPEDAVIREVKEETGLEVQVISKIADRIHPRTGKEIIYFHCEFVGGEESVDGSDNDDIERLIWISVSELNKYMPTVFDKVLEYFNQN